MARLQDRVDAVTEYVEFPACGHIPMDEYPEEFVTALRPFVEKVLRQSSSVSSDDSGHGSGNSNGTVLQGAKLLAAADGVQDMQTLDSVAATR